MKNNYWRISYKKTGIYEALKKEIWKVFESPKNEWDSLKCSESFTWLKTPTVYSDKCLSYFTESGYKLFMEKTYPIIIKYLNSKDIIISK